MTKLYQGLKLRFRYARRIFRSEMLRFFLYLILPLFTLEKYFRPVDKGEGKRILIIIIGGLGDCLLFDPLFRRLKEKWPGARIDVLTGCFEDMWERLDSIDNLIYFTPSGYKLLWKYASLFRIIYRNSYDIVAEGIAMVPMRGIYPVFTSLIFEASRAPIRIGRKNTGSREGMRPREGGFISSKEMLKVSKKNGTPKNNISENPFLTHIINLLPPDKRQYHESEKIFEPLGLVCFRKKDEPRLGPNPEQDKWAEKLLRTHWASRDDIIVGFIIETTRMIKSWPVENFVSVLKWGISDNLKFVMLGLTKQSSSSPFKTFSPENLLDLTGKTCLGEMISVIGQCNLFLSCDTGPAHIAQACRVPTIVLFGPSNEMEFGPVDRDLHSLILPPEDLECRPCVLGPCIMGKSCINLITPETVYKELKQKVGILSTSRRKPEIKSHTSPNVLCTL